MYDGGFACLFRQVVVRGVKVGNSPQRSRELHWLLRKRSVMVGELRARVSREMGHPATQVHRLYHRRESATSPKDFTLLYMSVLGS